MTMFRLSGLTILPALLFASPALAQPGAPVQPLPSATAEQDAGAPDGATGVDDPSGAAPVLVPAMPTDFPPPPPFVPPPPIVTPPPPIAPEPPDLFESPAAGQPMADVEVLSLQDLLEIKFSTGSFLELDLRSSPVSLDIIRRYQIEASGARHLGELLEIYVPGFQYMYNKWNGSLWGMRGVANDRNTKIIFLINGVKQNTESRDGFYTEQELGLLGDIERVEVLRGQAGLVYGSGAIAGVVNVVTRAPTRSMATARVASGYGEWREAEILANTNLADDVNLTMSFGYRQSAGYGVRRSRIFGNLEWPFPSAPQYFGAPPDGSPWATPGNTRIGADFRAGNFRLETRVTRQQSSAGQFFVVDPWPDFTGEPPPTATDRVIDGVPQMAGSSPYRTAESYGTNRRVYRTDNVSVVGSYRHPLGPDSISGRLGWFGFSNNIYLEPRAGYGKAGSMADPAGKVTEAFGERRYLATAQYLLKRVPRLQSAFGVEFRVDDLGRDLNGQNHTNTEDHLAISNIVYTNVSSYVDNYYRLNSWVAFDLGMRVDKHTRTGAVFSPKAALIVTPHEDHSIKLFIQASSNNGTVDNYEYNRNSLDDLGRPLSGPRLLDPKLETSDRVLPGVKLSDLHSLKPERAFSIELASTHRFLKSLTILPSVSYTRTSNLFAWHEEIFRVVNTQPYDSLVAEVAAFFEAWILRAGGSHSLQQVVRMSDDVQTVIIPSTQILPNGDGTFRAEEIPGDGTQIQASLSRSQISRDGTNFLNLSRNTSKLFVDVRPTSWLTLNTNVRVFWGLAGRKQFFDEDLANGYHVLGLESGATATIIKLGAGAIIALPHNLVLGIHGYDLLGTPTNRHALRWQQMSSPVQRSLYTVDLPTVIASLSVRY